MFDGTLASLTDEYRVEQLTKMDYWVPTKDELERLNNKYHLWKKLHFKETNCPHCIFNHFDCKKANKHFPFKIYYEGAICHAFLMEGNYII